MREQKIMQIDNDKLITCHLNNLEEIRGRAWGVGSQEKNFCAD